MSLWQRWQWSRLQQLRQRAAEALPDCGAKRCYQRPLPRAGQALSETPLLAIDLEMTGLAADRGEIVSFGWVPITPGRRGLQIDLKQAQHVLIESDAVESVGESATIHGIRDCDRAPGVPLAQGLAALFEALHDRIAVFHHAPLDTAYLDRACRKVWQVGWMGPVVDTLAWHRRRQLSQDQAAAAEVTQLDALRRWYDLDARAAHNALDDALSCAELVLILNAEAKPRLGAVAR
ncbi:MAG: exonuclease domain-containing protein [Pseudomonadota bacterium]